MGQFNNHGWINAAANKRHAGIIVRDGVELARMWDHTPEAARERAEKLRSLQCWRDAKVVMHEA